MKIDKNYRPELVVCQDGTSLPLTQVHLDVEGKRVVATNGSSLVVCPVEQSEADVSGSVPVEALKLARKLCKQERRRSVDGKRWEYETPPCTVDLADSAHARMRDGSTLPRPDLGKFPPFDRVIPDYPDSDKTLVRLTLNAHLLAELATAMDADGITLTFPAPGPGAELLSPIKVTARDRDNEAFGVLMPMRGGKI
jgi:hypothetical protein